MGELVESINDQNMNIENGVSPVQIPSEKPESRKVYPFSMRKLKEQAKKICSKNGGDFTLVTQKLVMEKLKSIENQRTKSEESKTTELDSDSDDSDICISINDSSSEE